MTFNLLDSETTEIAEEALKKIKGQKEKDLCKFLPGDGSGYMHHFTLKKMSNQTPEEFKHLLQEFIINPEQPKLLEPKKRNRKNKSIHFNSNDLQLLVRLAQKAGDSYLLSKLVGKLSLPKIKKELIQAIKTEKIEQDLWESYVHAISLKIDD